MSEMSALSSILLIIGTITAIGGFMYSMYKIAKRIDDAIGTDSQGRTLSERMGRVEHQLWENGGESLKDQVNLIQTGQIEIKAEMTIIKELLIASVGKPRKAKISKAS